MELPKGLGGFLLMATAVAVGVTVFAKVVTWAIAEGRKVVKV